MEKINIFFKKYSGILLAIFIFAIFIIYSAKKAFLSGRMGWEDESHFWIIVKNCTIAQIFDLMKVEGHMMLWYLIVKPFSTFFPYPYPMQILNWLFCLAAMIIIWIKSPFEKYIKCLIILCPVFLQLYAIHARCYSLSCFLLFFACALYKDRIKRPFLYFTILFLAANTHLQTLFAATGLGLIFLYDLIKEKKYKETSIIILLTILTGIMFFFQFHGVSTPDYENIVSYIVNDTNNLAIFLGIYSIHGNIPLLLKIIAARIFVIFLTFIYAQKPRVFFLYIFIFFTSITFFTNVYLPRYWHQAFFLVYFIVTYWIYLEEKPKPEIKKYLNSSVLALLLVLLQMHVILPHDNDFFAAIKDDKNSYLREGKLFTNIWPITVSTSLPKLNEENIYIYDMHGRNLSSYEGLKTYYSEELKKYEPEEIYKHLDNHRNNYLIAWGGISDKNRTFKNLKRKKISQEYTYGYTYSIYLIQKKQKY